MSRSRSSAATRDAATPAARPAGAASGRECDAELLRAIAALGEVPFAAARAASSFAASSSASRASSCAWSRAILRSKLLARVRSRSAERRRRRRGRGALRDGRCRRERPAGSVSARRDETQSPRVRAPARDIRRARDARRRAASERQRRCGVSGSVVIVGKLGGGDWPAASFAGAVGAVVFGSSSRASSRRDWRWPTFPSPPFAPPSSMSSRSFISRSRRSCSITSWMRRSTFASSSSSRPRRGRAPRVSDALVEVRDAHRRRARAACDIWFARGSRGGDRGESRRPLSRATRRKTHPRPPASGSHTGPPRGRCGVRSRR